MSVRVFTSVLTVGSAVVVAAVAAVGGTITSPFRAAIAVSKTSCVFCSKKLGNLPSSMIEISAPVSTSAVVPWRSCHCHPVGNCPIVSCGTV